MTILEAAAAMRERRVSSRELVIEALKRIAKRDADLNTFITVTEPAARVQASSADDALARGEDRGPLHGIPVALKDVFYLAGVRNTSGAKVFDDFVPDYDAAVVERLAKAGAVILGKTNMHEMAYGITSTNPHYGAVKNPWDEARIPGGSSGGSGAAVAAGMAMMAMGTDTGGSIRIPASFCGVVGLKPTFGRVSRHGVTPLGFSLDHMGPLARTVRDAAVTLNAIAGHDPRDPASSAAAIEDWAPPAGVSIGGLRIGVPENFYFDRVDPAVAAAVRDAAHTAESLGAFVQAVRVPDIAALNTVARVILLAEASAVMERHMNDRDRFGADVLPLLDQGRLVHATDYINAQRLRREMQDQFRTIWRGIDCLFTPATPTTAPRIGQTEVSVAGEEEDVRLASTRLVRGINALGIPALSMPCGFDRNGLPIGLQILAAPFAEATLLRTGAAIEDALGLLPRLSRAIR